MENLKSMADILLENIQKSSSPMTIDLKNNIIRYSTNDFQPLLRLAHRQSHKNVLFTLTNCSQAHCIECISELGKCEHNKSTTKYELYLFKLLSRRLSLPQLNIESLRFCKSCNSPKSPLYFTTKPCFCECFWCIKNNIIKGKYACSLCSSQYNTQELEKLYQRSNERYPGVIKQCPKCKLPIHAEGFKSELCLICYKIREFL